MTKSDQLQAAATRLAEADHHLTHAMKGGPIEIELARALRSVNDARVQLADLIGQRKRAGVDDEGQGG